MAHPRQLIEALMKRLLDAKKVNKSKPASERAFRTQYRGMPGRYENPDAPSHQRHWLPYDDVGEMRNVVPTAAESEARTIAGPGRGDTLRTFVDDPKGVAVRKARQEAREAQPSDPLAKPIDMREGSRPRDPSRLPDLAPEDPLKRPVESGLSRYLPEENIHEPMMPRTRDGSVRSRDPSRLPKSPDPIQDDVISNMPRPNPQEDAQKLFETLFNDAARGRDVDPRRLSMLDDMYPPYADIVEMEMKAQGKGIGGATIADDLDDIPF